MFGETKEGTTYSYIPENVRHGTRYNNPETEQINTIRAYISPWELLGYDVLLKACIYDLSNNQLVALSEEVALPPVTEKQPRWVNFPLPSTITLPPGNYIPMLHIGQGRIAFYGFGGQSAVNSYRVADAYADGTDELFNPTGEPPEEFWTNYSINAVLLGPTPQPPTAKFIVSPSPPLVNKRTTFDATPSLDGWTGTETAPIIGWAWDFGDGVTGEGQIVENIFKAKGYYDVTLTVEDSQGLTNSKTLSIYVAAGEITSFTVGFEEDIDFQVCTENKCNAPACTTGCVYWNRGGWSLTQAPTECLFEAETNPAFVHSGNRSAKLELVNPHDDLTRRVQIYHNWNPLTAEHIWTEETFFLPEDFPMVDPATGESMWHSLATWITERMWNPGLPSTFQQYALRLGVVWDAANNKPIFSFTNGAAEVDNNDDGINDLAGAMFEKYFSFSPEGVPLGKWIKIKGHVYRNLANFDQGYVEFWIQEITGKDTDGNDIIGREIYRKEDPCRTIGINPARLASLPPSCHEPGTEGKCAWLSSGFTNYQGGFAGSFGPPSKLWVDDVYMAATGPSTHLLTIASTVEGTTSPESGNYEIIEGDILTVTAIPADGYTFDHWTLDGETFTENPINILSETAMDGKTLTAYFTAVVHQWVLTVIPTTGGTTTPSGSIQLDEGQTATVTALPTNGYRLNHWELDGENIGSENPVTIPAQPVETSHTLVAIFSPTPKIPSWLPWAFGLSLFGIGLLYVSIKRG